MTAAPSSSEVVIIGAGPAGMVLAYLLATHGVRVHVLERHPDFKREFRGEGIQPSVVEHLRQLGMLQPLLARGIAVPARRAEVFLDGRLVVTIGNDGRNSTENFGIVLHQEQFLAFLDVSLAPLPNYRLTTGANVRGVHREGERITAVEVERRGDATTMRVEGGFFVTTAGRGTGLRDAVGLAAVPNDKWFNILWMMYELPDDPALVPEGFRVFLDGDSLFAIYRTAGDRLQVAWARRDERGLREKDFAARRAHLLGDAPSVYRPMFERGFQTSTRTQFLRVESDRLPRWHVPGMLFLGDAAHTMSPIAAQGINLAIRDAIVASNHMLAARARGEVPDEALCARIQLEREHEIRVMQRFQSRLGYIMFGAPRWQMRALFRVGVPVLDALGVRRRLITPAQHGVDRVAIDAPVRWPPRI